MLEIANSEYRLPELTEIGQTAQRTSKTPLTAETLIGEAELTWAHLQDARIRILLETRARYRFTTWTQLTETLDATWVLEELDETNETTPPIPAALNGHVVLPRTEPVELPPGITLEATFTQVRQTFDTHPDLVSIPTPDRNWNTAATATARIDRHNALQKLWGVCGMASQSLIERLYAADAGVIQTFNRVFEGADDARLLQAVLLLPVKETVFINIAEPAIHEFTLEKRADGTTYLHQGYLGAYSAMWWAGVKGTNGPPFFTLGGKQAQAMRESREAFGRGQAIPNEVFAWMMYNYLSSDTHGPGSGEAWKKLPFNPGSADEAERWKGNSITLQVKGFEIVDEPTARRKLADNGRNLPLTTLVMEEAARLLAK